MEFSYKARTKEGKLQSGIVEASGRQGALEVLQRHRLTVVSLEEQGAQGTLFKNVSFQYVNAKDIAMFSRSFASLFDAGIPLLEGLRILADQVESTYFRTVILQVVDDVDGGMKLSEALSKHPKVFSEFYYNMIRAGESSGALQGTLIYLADYTERDYALRSSIRSALLYPGFIISVFIIVFFIMMIFVVPRLNEILLQLSPDDLPAITRIIIGLSTFTLDWFLVILALIGVLIVWFVRYLRTDVGREQWDQAQLSIPIFGPLFKTVYQARFADNLATLIRGGIPIIEAMNITARVVGNSLYRGLILKVAEEVKAGHTIESVIKNYEEFSPLLTQMVAVGERSGKLDEVLQKIAEFFETEVDRKVKGLTPLLEPFLIIILGVGVGILVAAILLPIYSIVGNVGSF